MNENSPDDDAVQHSQKVRNRIFQELSNNNGIISFARFMELALYEPGLGYYMAGGRKIGEDGDFITAPELTSVFSHCLAMQCEQILNTLDSGNILELGPGKGTMACDILQKLERLGNMPHHYFMLETSAELRERQEQLVKQRIPHLRDKVCWLDTLADEKFHGIILANEVLDALPFHRISINKDSVNELCVGIDQDQMVWLKRPPLEELKKHIDNILISLEYALPEGYISEINCRIAPLINSLADFLKRGVMLFIDYGYVRREYYHPQRVGGTMLCHSRHLASDDPFMFPGIQDITASVDFTLLADSAKRAGLKLGGYSTQAHFLMGCGLAQIMNENPPMSDMYNVDLSQKVKMLTMPGEMGEIFKVMALTKDLDISLRGFKIKDFRSQL